MDKNIKIALGCFGAVILLGGIIFKGLNEKSNQEDMMSKINENSNVTERFEEMINKQRSKYDQFKNQIKR